MSSDSGGQDSTHPHLVVEERAPDKGVTVGVEDGVGSTDSGEMKGSGTDEGGEVIGQSAKKEKEVSEVVQFVWV